MYCVIDLRSHTFACFPDGLVRVLREVHVQRSASSVCDAAQHIIPRIGEERAANSSGGVGLKNAECVSAGERIGLRTERIDLRVVEASSQLASGDPPVFAQLRNPFVDGESTTAPTNQLSRPKKPSCSESFAVALFCSCVGLPLGAWSKVRSFPYDEKTRSIFTFWLSTGTATALVPRGLRR